ncbi:MAG: HAD-IIA family hydrolase [Chloroflexi bacterium]|nr:HAD-IIA family hydrolase [Chloroflexota bacterium]
MTITAFNFSEISGVIMDMDGVLWRGDQALPGLHEIFAFLRARDLPHTLATNNSSRTPDDYVHKLERMGVPGVKHEQIVSSATATVAYLRDHYTPGTVVHVLGGDGLKALISEAGFTLATDDLPEDAVQVAVSGIDFNLTYATLRRTMKIIRAGADFIGTNGDATIPTPDGFWPGAGSILAALQTATDRSPQMMGKPHAPMFEAALGVMGTDPAYTLMIGDRINTDIAGAADLGMPTVLVLTGVTTRDQLNESRIQPNAVYADLPGLLAAWESAAPH